MISPTDDELPPVATTLRRQNANPTTENPMAFDLKHSSNADLVANNGELLKKISKDCIKSLISLSLFSRLTSCKEEAAFMRSFHDKDKDPDTNTPVLAVSLVSSAA